MKSTKEKILHATGGCSLGHILVASSKSGICAIFLGDDPDTLVKELHHRFPQALLSPGEKSLHRILRDVTAFADNPGGEFGLPLDIRGTPFQCRVWQALRKIPPGSTSTYSEIANRIGSPRAVRAVAAACANNTIALAIPCHRVIQKNGRLAGYRWGVDRKLRLLEKEGVTNLRKTPLS